MKPIMVSISTSGADPFFASLSTDYYVFSYNYHKFGRFHYHTSYELEFLVEGELEVHINSDKYHCFPGHFWLVHPNSFHQIIQLSENAKIISIKFNEKAITNEILLDLQSSYKYYIGSMTEEQSEYISSEIDNMFVQLGRAHTKIFEKTLIKCTTSQMIGKLLDTPQNSGRVDCNSFPKKLIESVEYVREHHAENLTRNEVAKKFGFSVSYYSTIFKKYTGKGFSNFLLSERLKDAYYLLMTTGLSVGEISEKAGFESFTYFSKAFKKAYGQTPSTARKAVDSFIIV